MRRSPSSSGHLAPSLFASHRGAPPQRSPAHSGPLPHPFPAPLARAASARFPRRTRQVMLVQRLPHEGLDHGLPAHVERRRGLVQFLQHAGREIDVHPPDRLHHLSAVGEEPRHVLAPVGHPRDRLRRARGSAGAGRRSGSPGDGSHPPEQEEVVAAKVAAVGVQEPEEGLLHEVPNAHAAELDGAAIRAGPGEQPGEQVQHGLALAFGLAARGGSGRIVN